MANRVGTEGPLPVKAEGPFYIHQSDNRRAPWFNRVVHGTRLEDCITRIAFGTTRCERRYGIDRLVGRR